jgi:hypothetical protein
VCVVHFYRNETKRNGHELFWLEKDSSTGRKTHIFYHSFSSRLMRFLPEYYPLMSADLSHKIATLNY